MLRIAVVVSHPIQYYAPIFRELAAHVDLKVFYTQQATGEKLATGGFGMPYLWDVDLLSGYEYRYLTNIARTPDLAAFWGSDTPDIGSELKCGHFDVVLVFGWYLKSLMQAIIAAKQQRLPLMVRGDSHLMSPRSILTRVTKAMVYPSFLRLFDAALYVGRYSRQYYEHYRYPDSRLFFSPHCVDNAWFESRATGAARSELRGALGIGAHEKVALFAGKLVPFKRPIDLVEAVAKLNIDRRVHVMIAGSGVLESAIRVRASALGVSLHMLGFQNQSQMPRAYAAADALVLSSTSRETWGLVANEALACGLPIVVSDAVGCAPDLAGDGVAGAIAPIGDIDSLSQTIARVLVAPPAPAAMRRRSREYSVERAVSGICEAAEFVCGR